MATRSQETQDNQSNYLAANATLVAKICSFQSNDLSEVEHKALCEFLAKLYSNIPSEDIAGVSVERLRAKGMSFWDFAQERVRRGDGFVPKVRVFNPDAEADGGGSAHTAVEIICDDMPFIVASVMAEITDQDLEIEFLSHPIVEVYRDARGLRQVELAADHEDGVFNRESMIHMEVSFLPDEDQCAALAESIEAVLAHVVLAVTDWKPMDARFSETLAEMENSQGHISDEEFQETAAFLNWLSHDHFLFFGARDYVYEGGEQDGELIALDETSLGVLKDPSVVILRRAGEPRHTSPLIREALMQPSPITVTKSNSRSLVHRRAYMDFIGVKTYTPEGKLKGERRFVGLFTSGAYNSSVRDIPFLRHKAQRVIERSSFASGSHDANALQNIIETFPRDELFQIDVEDLGETVHGILRLAERPRAKVFFRRDNFDRFVSVLVYVPRERFSSRLRKRVGKHLAEALHGRQSTFYTRMGDEPLARVYYIIGRSPGAPDGLEDETLEAEVIDLIRSWTDKLENELGRRWPVATADRLARRYRDAFSEAYKESFSAPEAADDIEILEALGEARAIDAHCNRAEGDPDYAFRLKLYHCGEALALTDAMPILENMGLNVISEYTYPVKRYFSSREEDQQPVWVHQFYVEQNNNGAVDLSVMQNYLVPAVLAVWADDAENDGFNRLVISPGMAWRDIVILRALAKYRLQTGITYSQAYMEEALVENAKIAQLLIDLFTSLHNPALDVSVQERRDRAAVVRQKILKALEEVASLDQDRIISRLLNLIDAITRTNFFQPGPDGVSKPYVSFKLDCEKVEDLPEPRPHAEIFVYSPRVEGVHLRGGPVARGGLRWSDRREDFRTEVLGLVKAQQVKNSVIVPQGAKGGFFPKALPARGTREEIQAEAIEAYKTFVRGLLDITDNLPLAVGSEEVIRPDQVVCYDGPDPYLVVAADKGTATFSDIANSVSAEYGFWLGDAFASGGSVGYDHKAMGITARGAWEAVKRHFREVGKDIQNESFTVVGVGDMSGDVFGNGMLLSRHIKLVAAFDHRHIFIDPTPDVDVTYAERKRLFETPRSSWNDFNRDFISQGGGIFPRDAKSIPVSGEMAELLNIAPGKITPVDLMQAILRAKADLMWFGGIGTYVKSEEESAADVGDRTNDAIRINARELRVQVVGEGANLGCTQRGRMEFARHGGRINMDAIDNAAGVDCSDHEVNIKILIDAAVASGKLSVEERSDLLAAMTDEVAELVLKNHYEQTLALSVATSSAHGDRDSDGRLMRALEARGRLDRALEFLPSDERLKEMAEAGHGMARPALAVLMSYAKIDLFNRILDSELPEDPALNDLLVQYFPKVLAERFPEEVHNHRLRREIISTELANRMVNIGGITFAHRLVELTGARMSDVARAFVVSCQLFDVLELRRRINGFDNQISAALQTDMHTEIIGLLRQQVSWLLSMGRLSDIRETTERYRAGIKAVHDAPRSVVIGFEVGAIEARVNHFTDAGVDHDLASDIAILRPMAAAGDIVELAECSRLDIEQVASAYFLIGAELRLDRLRAIARQLSSTEHYDRLAIKRLVNDLAHYQRQVGEHALTSRTEKTGNERVHAWLLAHGVEVGRFRQLFDELETAGGLNIAKLSLLSSQMHDLVQSLRKA
ncbi:MAG: NAD-glutamate dehydrogenase [Alphaproteobacteria bacterium]|nr:MAG: NAD-glutamate dehydrogenase [Alphaproteobacteria bacterium]